MIDMSKVITEVFSIIMVALSLNFNIQRLI